MEESSQSTLAHFCKVPVERGHSVYVVWRCRSENRMKAPPGGHLLPQCPVTQCSTSLQLCNCAMESTRVCNTFLANPIHAISAKDCCQCKCAIHWMDASLFWKRLILNLAPPFSYMVLVCINNPKQAIFVRGSVLMTIRTSKIATEVLYFKMGTFSKSAPLYVPKNGAEKWYWKVLKIYPHQILEWRSKIQNWTSERNWTTQFTREAESSPASAKDCCAALLGDKSSCRPMHNRPSWLHTVQLTADVQIKCSVQYISTMD